MGGNSKGLVERTSCEDGVRGEEKMSETWMKVVVVVVVTVRCVAK